jgi:hypothetical protein
MSGKNPLGNSKEPQAYEGINVIVPVGGWRVVRSTRNPSSNDTKYPIASLWVNTSNNTCWILTSNPGSWTEFAASVAGAIISITGDSGGAELPSAGNFNILGTANQVAVTGSAATQTISLIGPYTPATFTNHGVLLGAGTSSITALAVATDGLVLNGNTGAGPSFNAIGTKSNLTAHGVVLAEGNSAFVATTAGTNGQLLIGGTGDPAFASLTTSTGVAFTTGNNTLAVDVKTGGYAVVNQNTSSASLAAQTMYVTNNGASLVTYTLPATVAQGVVIKIVGSSAGGWKIAQNNGQTIRLNGSISTSGTGGSVSSTNANNSVELTAIDATTNVWVITGSSGGTLTFV